jgi:hypothetical protein
MAVIVKSIIFWDVTPYRVVYHHHSPRFLLSYLFDPEYGSTICPSETSINFYHTAQRYIPENRLIRPKCKVVLVLN